MTDVLITPASGKIEFFDSSDNIDAKIELDAFGNLNITSPGGDIALGDTTADVYIGDGVNNVDIRFEQAGTITGQTGISLTLGEAGSNILLGTSLNLNNNPVLNANYIDINSYGQVIDSAGNWTGVPIGIDSAQATIIAEDVSLALAIALG